MGTSNLTQTTTPSQAKLKSKSGIIKRLKILAHTIDKLIATEESLLPDCCELDVITGKERIEKHTGKSGRYIKFGLIYYLECLED